MLKSASHRYASMSLYLLVVGLSLLPLVISYSTLDYTLAPRFTYFGVLLVLLALLQFMSGGKRVSISKAIWPFVTFIIIECCSLLFATTPTEGMVPLLRDTGLLFFMIVLAQLGEYRGAMATISKALVLVNAIIGTYGMYQLFESNAIVDETKLYEVISLMAHRNLFASALVLTLPFVVFISWQSKGLWRWLSLVLFAHSSFLIFVLESRTAWLAFFTFIIAYPIWILFERIVFPIKKKTWGILYALALVAAFSIFGLSYATQQRVEQRGQELKSELGLNTTNESNFTIDERVMLWKGTLRMVWSENFAGVGAGNWKIMFPAFGSDIWRARQGMVQFQRPHNDFLWVLSETGILGLLAYLSGFVVLIFVGLQALSGDEEEPNRKVFIRLLLAGVLAYIMVAFFSFPRERIFHQLVLYIMFGMIMSFSKSRLESGVAITRAMGIAGVLIGGLMVWVGTNWWHGEQVVRKINEARARGDWNHLLENYEQIEASRFYKIDAVSIPVSFYSGLAYLNLEKYHQSEEEFLKAYQLHPNNIHVINNVANIYFLQGETDSAIVYYKRALQVSPKYLDGALNLMAAYFNTGQIDEAYDLLRRYEETFGIEDPAHKTLKTYRLAILNARKAEILQSNPNEEVRLFLESLGKVQLEELHFESLEQELTLEEIIRNQAIVR